MLTRRKTKIEVIIYILIPSSDSQSKPKLPINQTIKKKGLTCYEILKVCKQLNIFKYGIASDGFIMFYVHYLTNILKWVIFQRVGLKD